VVWDVEPEPVLFVNNVAIVYDLVPTLPQQIRRGGQFAVSPNGSPLPAGIVLTPEGILVVTLAAAPGSTAGVVFSYTEPA
jgi:hypothetical protein